MTIEKKEVLAPKGPAARPAPVSIGILVVCVVMFILRDRLVQPWVIPGTDPPVVQPLQWGTLFGPLVRDGQWWRLLSYAAEHGSPMHLFFNGSAVWSLGFPLERLVGSWRFALISVAGTLGCAAFALIENGNVMLVGASGMILAWAGALLPILASPGRKSLAWSLMPVVVISLLPGVSFAGHLGGFAFGVPFGFALRRGGPFFKVAAPVLVFLSAIVAVIATNPGRLLP